LIAAQNCSASGEGAFTGEINASGLSEFGIRWVIIGHSERRQLYSETDKDISAKVKVALANGLKVVSGMHANTKFV
jgi:triosephosphate isomerase